MAITDTFYTRTYGSNSATEINQDAGAISNKVDKFMSALDPNGNPNPKMPRYSTAARTYIRIGGKPLTIAQSFRWQIEALATPIQTIDSLFPWDIDIGQVTIGGQLSEFVDPLSSAEAQGLFHTMQSIQHQPFIELQALDSSGTSIFFARGMFTAINGNVTRGQLSSFSVTFHGVAYAHNVFQSFKPYSSVAGAVSGLLGGLKNITSTISGGFL